MARRAARGSPRSQLPICGGNCNSTLDITPITLPSLGMRRFAHGACIASPISVNTPTLTLPVRGSSRGFNGRHAYFFVAIEKGYYRDVGLDVKVVRGQGSVDAIRQVGANNAIVGFADAGSLVLARGNDQIPVKLVAIVYAKP